MSLWESPFYLLQVATETRKTAILSAAEERELLQGDGTARELANRLTNPGLRLEEEVAWLPGVSAQETASILQQVKAAPRKEPQSAALSRSSDLYCAKANVLAQRVAEEGPGAENLTDMGLLMQYTERIVPEKLIEQINQNRRAAGLPAVESVAKVKQALEKQQREWVRLCKLALDRYQSEHIGLGLGMLLELLTKKRSQRAPQLAYSLVDAYEVEAQGFFAAATPALRELVRYTSKRAGEDVSQVELAYLLGHLLRLTYTWEKLAQPLELAKESRLQDDRQSRQVAVDLCTISAKLLMAAAREPGTKLVFWADALIFLAGLKVIALDGDFLQNRARNELAALQKLTLSGVSLPSRKAAVAQTQGVIFQFMQQKQLQGNMTQEIQEIVNTL